MPYEQIDRFKLNIKPLHERKNKFNEFHALALTNRFNLSVANLESMATEIGLKQDSLSTCLESPEVEAYLTLNENLAKSLNIQSLPAFFFNNAQIKAPSTIEGWKAILGI